MIISVKGMMMTLAMVLTIAFAYAQPQGGGRGGNPVEQAKKETERLILELELNKKQTKKVEAINLKYAKEMQQIRTEIGERREAGEEIDRDAIRTKMQVIRTNHDEEVKSLLTPTQIEKFDAMLKPERGGKARAKRGKKGKKGQKPSKEEIEEAH
ncbi:MAG: Spy/CpxP family protein refolding chaperone [Saprospiraceae bacterium]|jgi:Spy/CpxP family protein refolding chaperone